MANDPLFEFESYFFDLDGTILDSGVDILASLVEAYTQAGFPLSDATAVSSEYIGKPLKEIISLLSPQLDSEQCSHVERCFRKIYDTIPYEGTIIYPGMLDFLCSLKKKNKKIFIVTNKPMLATTRLLQALGINFFDDVYTIDRMTPRAPKSVMITHIITQYGLKKETSIMFGDTLIDVRAAIDADISSCALLWGYEKDKDLLKKLATYSIDQL